MAIELHKNNLKSNFRKKIKMTEYSAHHTQDVISVASSVNGDTSNFASFRNVQTNWYKFESVKINSQR